MDGQNFYKRFKFEFNPENNHDVKDVFDKDKVQPDEVHPASNGGAPSFL